MENSIEEDIGELKRLLYRNELTQYGKRKLINYYEQQEKNYKRVLKENEELKDLMAHKNAYTKKLEKDLFENCENHVISKDKIKEKIKEYNKLADSFYNKWKDLSPLDENYRDIKDTGMCCDAKVSVLQELLKG